MSSSGGGLFDERRDSNPSLGAFVFGAVPTLQPLVLPCEGQTHETGSGVVAAAAVTYNRGPGVRSRFALIRVSQSSRSRCGLEQARAHQAVIRCQTRLREAASLPIHRKDERAVPRLRCWPCPPAGVRRSGRAFQHAVADDCGGEGQGQDRGIVPLMNSFGEIVGFI